MKTTEPTESTVTFVATNVTVDDEPFIHIEYGSFSINLTPIGYNRDEKTVLYTDTDAYISAMYGKITNISGGNIIAFETPDFWHITNILSGDTIYIEASL